MTASGPQSIPLGGKAQINPADKLSAVFWNQDTGSLNLNMFTPETGKDIESEINLVSRQTNLAAICLLICI